MKRKIFSAIILATLLYACSNDEASEQDKDSANMLNDTLPANGFENRIRPDSNPADATHVDSLFKATQ